MKKIFFLISTILSVHCCFAQPETGAKSVEFPKNYTAGLDEVYIKLKGWDGRLDVYYDTTSSQPRPVVINIHGGGWNHGKKEDQAGFGSFFKMGFAVANVEYRLTPQVTAPAAVEDIRCAMMWLVQNAKRLNIDPNKIVLMGSSAGGHLALMAGLLQNDHRFDANCKVVDSFTVVAIIDKFGPADLTVPGVEKSRSVVAWMGNNAGDLKFMKSVSPITYVNKNSPPVFIVHGDADPTVPYQQSVDLHKKLVELGVKTEFITVQGGLHGKFDKEKNSEISKTIVDFLKGLNLSK